MDTKILQVKPENVTPQELRDAGEILRRGGLVAFPTETVYGLGGDAMDAGAAAKIYEAKGRPSDNPLIVHIADMDGLENLAKEIPDVARKFAKAFWPGPLTMIFKKREEVPEGTTGGLDTVGVRMPEHPVALALIRSAGRYIAAPSANASGRPSPTLAEHVKEDLDGRIDMIIDGGAVGIGLESTIVDVTGDVPLILRPGCITAQMLEKVGGRVETDAAILAQTPQKNVVAKAPGMKYRHYAPRGEMTIVEGETPAVVHKIIELVEEKRRQMPEAKVAVVASGETRGKYPPEILVVEAGSREKEGDIAAHLYAVLRDLDTMDVQFIYAESFSTDTMGQAIMNRMRKAAGYRILRV